MIQSVALPQAAGDVWDNSSAPGGEKLGEQAGGGNSVHIVVAVDSDELPPLQGQAHPLGSRVHILQEKGVGDGLPAGGEQADGVLWPDDSPGGQQPRQQGGQPRPLQGPPHRQAHQQGGGHFNQVKGDEGEHTGGQGLFQAHLGLYAVPGGAEGVQHGGGQGHPQKLKEGGQGHALFVLSVSQPPEGPLRYDPGNEHHGQIAHQIAPGGAQQPGRAPHIVAEHRKAHKTQQQVHQSGHQPPAPPQQAGGEVEGQGPPGDGDGADGDGDGGQHTHHRRHHGAQGEPPGVDRCFDGH